MSSSLFPTLNKKRDLYLASSLCVGLEDKDIKQVKILLKNKEANPNVLMPCNGITPFHLVIGNDSEVFAEESTKIFLQYGGHPNVKSIDDVTPVHIAAAWGRIKILELLLSNGGDPLAIDSDNNSPFHYAFQGKHYEAIYVLNKYCINKVNQEQPQFKVELDNVIINNSDVTEYLISNKQLFDSSYKYSSTFRNNNQYSKININNCISENNSADTILINNNFFCINKYQRKRAIEDETNKIHINIRKENHFDFNKMNVESEEHLINEINLQSSSSSNTSEVDTNNTTLKNDKNQYLVKYKTSLSKIEQIIKYLNKSKKYKHLKFYEKQTTNNKNYPLQEIKLYNHLPCFKNYNHVSNMNKWVDESIISKSPNLEINSYLYSNKKTSLESLILKKKILKIQPKCAKISVITSNKVRCETSNIYNSNIPINLRSSLKRYDTNVLNPNETNGIEKIPNLITSNKHKFNFLKKVITTKKPKNVNHLDYITKEPIPSTILIPENNRNNQEIESKTKNLDKYIYTTNQENKETNLNIYVSRKLKKTDKYFFTFQNKLSKLLSGSRIIPETEILNANITSKTNLRLKKKETQTMPEKDVDLNQAIFYSFTHVESVTEKQNFNNPKEFCDNLQCIKDSPLSKSSDCFSLAKFDSHKKNNIESQENINIKSLFFSENNISYKNFYLKTYFDMETEYKNEDSEKDVLLERRLYVSPNGISSMNTSSYSCSTTKSELLKKKMYCLDNITLRERLKNLGENPGPITNKTYHLYLKHLHKLETQNRNFIHLNSVSNANIKYLNNVDREKKILKYSQLNIEWIKKLDDFETIEQKVFQEFINPNPSCKWREGNSKNSFNYLLLDPRITKNFLRKASKFTLSEKWETFLSAIFYIGKGKQSRPYAHLYDAFKLWVSDDQQNVINMKIQRILDIWNEGKGVIVLHVFHNTIPVEAYTREAAMIEMLGTEKLGNCKYGNYYGVVATWKKKAKYELGKYLLFKALQILLVEGEREIYPDNL